MLSKLKVEERFFELLKHLRFSEHPIDEPHSLGIEWAIANSSAGGIFGTGRFRRKALLLVPERMRQAFRKHLEERYPEEQYPEASEQFEALAQAFDQEVAKFESENPL